MLLVAVAWFAAAAPCRAAEPQDPLSGAFAPTGDSLDFRLREAPAGRGGDPSLTDQRLHAAVRVSSSAASALTLHATEDDFELGRSPVVAATGAVVPRSLWSLDAGAAFLHRLPGRREWGLSGSLGSASDEPFHSLHETTFRMTGTCRVPSGEENAWLFLLSYSNNRHFANNVPFPGVAYIVHSPEHGLDAVLGIPFLSVRWRPDEDWTTRAAVFGPRNVSLEEARRVGKEAQAYAGFDWNEQSWLPAGRTDHSQRLFYDAKRWSLGLRLPVAPALRLDLSAGYEFSRRFYENNRAVQKGVPSVGLAPTWTLGAGLAWRW